MRTLPDAAGLPALLAVALALPPAGAAVADSFLETFDEAGGGVAGRFSAILLQIDGGIASDPTGPGLGAPSTGGLLPIDEGGDNELRFYDVGLAAGGSNGYALTPEQGFADPVIDGYVAIGVTGDPGTRTAALLLRAGGDSIATLDAWSASFSQPSPTTARVAIQRFENGIGQAAEASSDSFPFVSDMENYRLVFSAEGDLLTLAVWRVEAIGGEAVETPVDLDDGAPGVQNTLTATDPAPVAGAVGVRTFTGSSNVILFDDVAVTDRIFTDGFESGDTVRWSATVP
jgi:hypothetical protein